MSPFARDGRRIMDPPCEYGHTRQAMECPSCSERVTGNPSSVEWSEWYRRRYGRAPLADARREKS